MGRALSLTSEEVKPNELFREFASSNSSHAEAKFIFVRCDRWMVKSCYVLEQRKSGNVATLPRSSVLSFVASLEK